MFRFQQRDARRSSGRFRPAAPFRYPIRPRVEQLEDRRLLTGTVTITFIQGPSSTSTTVPIATEGVLTAPSLNATFTDTNAVAPGLLTVTINYGDGTPVASNQAGANFDANLVVTRNGTTYTVSDQHTFPEESGSTVPPFAFTATLTLTENGNAANTDTATTPAQVLDAALSPGDPVQPGVGTVFTGGNQGNATTAGQALTNFEAAIGGSKNTAAAPQSSGFRTITWDGVKTDGTDAAAGPNSTTVITAHTVGIPLDRFQGQGVFFGAVYGVTNDGFTDVNANVANLFPAFSTPNTFAMFNDNGIDFKFVAASSPNTALVSAASRGFGSIFLNVQQPGTTITYFHGSTVLDTLNVPTNSTAGAAVFAGELFTSPLVTNVLLTLGTGVIFKFDGTTVTSGGANTAANNLVAVDDWAFAEPVPVANGFPIVSGPTGTTNPVSPLTATQGTPFTGTVATFSDLDPNGNAKDYTATINWGDGHLNNGKITADGKGGFTVTGTNTFTQAGTFPISVDVADFGGGPGLAGSQPVQSVTNTIQVASAGNANQLYVSQLYLDLLGRTADSGGLTTFTNLLAQGASRGAVALAIETSAEYRMVEVGHLYQHYLHRTPDSGGLTSFTAFLTAGGTLEQAAAMIVSSPEYFQVRGGGTNSGWLAALYQDALGRAIDSGGATTWGNLLSGGGTLSQVATAILTSPEYRTHIVDVFYQDYLRRHADPAGSSGWVSVLNQGPQNGIEPDSLVIAGLVGSGEYAAALQISFPQAPAVPKDPLASSLP